jgi:hypothetical protein
LPSILAKWVSLGRQADYRAYYPQYMGKPIRPRYA